MICKTRKLSIFEQGMENSFMNFGLVFETALAATLSYAPGTDKVLRTFPVDWEAWVIPLPIMVYIMIYDECRKYFLRKYVDPRPSHYFMLHSFIIIIINVCLSILILVLTI